MVSVRRRRLRGRNTNPHPVLGRGMPRSQVERAPLAPGAPARLVRVGRGRRFRLALPALALGERAALERLEEAEGRLPGSRWRVGRVVTRSLERQGFVYVFRELVVLTDAGRGGLIAEREWRRGIGRS